MNSVMRSWKCIHSWLGSVWIATTTGQILTDVLLISSHLHVFVTLCFHNYPYTPASYI